MTVRELCKWGVKSVGGLAANVVLLTLWVDIVGIPKSIAIVPNFFLISGTGYFVANHWIWPDGVSPNTAKSHVTQWAGMQAANLTGKVGNYALYLVLLPVVDYRLAWIIGAVATFLITYAGNHIWWTRRSSVSERP